MSSRYSSRGPSRPSQSSESTPWGVIVLVFVVVVVIVGLVGLSIATSFVTGRDWFASLGYVSIFDIGWQTKWALFFIFSVPTLIFMLINALVFRWSWRTHKDSSSTTGGEDTVPLIFWILVVCSLIVAIAVGVFGSNTWEQYLLYSHAQLTHTTDPVFGQDISFYLFQLPFLHSMTNLLIIIAFLGLASILVAEGVMIAQKDKFAVSRTVVLHGGFWLLALLSLLGYGQWLGRFDYLFNHGSLVWGAGYTDIHVSIPWQAFALYVGIGLGVLALVGGLIGGRAWVFTALTPVLFILYWVAGGTYAGGIQNFQVHPNEFNLEKPYLQSQISGTQAAYGLNKFNTQTYTISPSASPSPSASGASSNTPVSASPTGPVVPTPSLISDPRLWDWPQLQEVYLQRQALRPYYTFPDVDIDRYTVNGTYQQVELAGREIDSSQLPSQAQTWTNQKLVYTHGYGLVASPVDQATTDGYPTYLASDIPTTGPLQVSQPDIYYGERMSGYVLAPNTANEFDHPSASGDATTHYTGTHAPLVSAHRFLWACATMDLNILISPQISSSTRVLINRDPLSRAKALMPFLTYDADPYLVVSASGKLYWIIDAYATSQYYPYSESSNNYNYIRNSVKVVMDAYEGTVDFYVVDSTDPIVNTLSAIYPGVFKPIAQMPVDLQAHLRYPETLFNTQASMLLTYHVSDPQVFYNRGDVWDIPQIQSNTNAPQALVPYYVLATLPDSSKPEFLMILPLTPQGRSNLVAWMVARMDGSQYGQVNTYILPKDQNIDGPAQVSAQIQQNQAISTSFTLLDQHGSSVILGNLLAFPTAEGFLYLQPVYLRASSGASQPQLIKVILDLNGQVIYANTLADALAQLTGQPTPISGSTPPPSGGKVTIASLVQQAIADDAQAQQDLKSGDEVGYAQQEQQLHVVLQQIAALEKAGGS